MKMGKRITVLACMLVLGIGLIEPLSRAAGDDSKAGEAFAAALENGTIKYDSNSNYNIADMDGDGVKDLLVSKTSGNAFIYAYKDGSVKKILKYLPEYDLCYNAKKGLFEEIGEGDGAWHIFHKLTNGKLVEKFRLYTEYKNGSKLVYRYQKAGQSAKTLSKAAYNKKLKKQRGEYLQTSKEKLIDILKSL